MSNSNGIKQRKKTELTRAELKRLNRHKKTLAKRARGEYLNLINRLLD